MDVAVTGHTVELACAPETNPLDLRIYITDSRAARAVFKWTPLLTVERTVRDIFTWIRADSERLESILA